MPADGPRREAEARERQQAEPALDLPDRRAGRDERAQDHVAAGPGHAVEVDDRHRFPFARRGRAVPPDAPAAPPLSMFTTVPPAAHELSMARSGAIPPKEAP